VESQIAGTIAKSMTLLEEPLSRILSNRLSFLLSTHFDLNDVTLNYTENLSEGLTKQ